MSHVSHDSAQIDWFLNHGVEQILPSKDAFKERLLQDAPITVYLGVDPTATAIHMGNALMIRKLAELQQLGHKVILLIGDFTAMIGDPTDKMAARTVLTAEQVRANMASYKEQAARLLSFAGENPAEIRYNSTWLGAMSFADVVKLGSEFTVQQMLERDMFQKRMAENKPIGLHEFFYPLMQGYDSVAMDVDAEIGGNDQLFNMLAGRTLMKSLKNKEKFVITGKLMTDANGKKMSKSEGNVIWLNDTPEDMYGKVMSWPDTMIMPGYELCTNYTADRVADVRARMAAGENPMQLKKDLAYAVTSIFGGGDEAAARGEEAFKNVHQEHGLPEDMAKLHVGAEISVVDALVQSGLVPSKSEARRQIEQGGVRVDDAVVTDVNALVHPTADGSILQKGKRGFAKLLV